MVVTSKLVFFHSFLTEITFVIHVLSQTVYDFLLALSSFHPQLLGWDQQQWLALPTWHSR